MSTQQHWAFLAAVVCLVAVVSVQSLPVDDDKANEMSIAAANNMEDEIEPSTENPKEEPSMELPKPQELDTNHIQVIKMPSAEEAKEIIEELADEIEREKETEMKELKQEVKKEEPKIDNKVETILPMEEATKVSETPKNEMMQPMLERSPRNMQMAESSQKEKAVTQTSSLTDEDIDKIMKMISFPQTHEVKKSENGADKKTATETEVEPRTTEAESLEVKTRIGRAIRSNGGKGYYILAFSPIEGPLVPSYTKFEIIPIERSVDGGSSNIDDFDADEQDNLQIANSEIEEGRLISRKQFNHYIRKMMRQIRKGTRKIQRKTRLRSAVEEEPTVENYVRKWYEISKNAQAVSPKPSWFTWGQKA